jgi:hypothetical protein
MVNLGNPFVHAVSVGLEFVEAVGHNFLLGIFEVILPLNFYIDLTCVYSYNIRMEIFSQTQTGFFRPDHDPPCGLASWNVNTFTR